MAVAASGQAIPADTTARRDMLCMQKLAVCPTNNFHSHALEPGIDSESLSVKSVSTETRLPMQ